MVDLNYRTESHCMKYKSEKFPTELVIHGEVKVYNRGGFSGITGITEILEDDYTNYR